MPLKRQNIRKSMLALFFLLFEYRIFHLFFSPVLILAGASLGIVNGTILIYGALFLSSLYFGRAWCGWLCPGSAINHVCSLIVEKRPKKNKTYALKYIISSLLFTGVALFAFKAGGFHHVDLLFGMNRESVSQDIILLFGAVAIIVPVSFAFGRYANCHYFCWQAPLLIIGTKIKEYFRWPSLHLNTESAACIDCGACDRNCPMGIQVSEMVRSGNMHNVECILCGGCVDNCPKGAIRFSFGIPERK